MEEEVTHRTNVGIPSFNIRPPKTTRRVVEEKISKGIIDNLNNVTYDLGLLFLFEIIEIYL